MEMTPKIIAKTAYLSFLTLAIAPKITETGANKIGNIKKDIVADTKAETPNGPVENMPLFMGHPQ